MNFFEAIPKAADDPVLHLSTLFKEDKRPFKVDLGVGIYKTDELRSWLLPSVKSAEEHLLKTCVNKDYLPIEGDLEYNAESLKLILGDNFLLNNLDRAFAVQTAGGTNALRIAADFLVRFGYKKIYISDPSWPNHKQIFTIAGLQVDVYPYYNKENHSLNFEGMKNTISTMPSGSIILLQPSCHNPTGVCPTIEQWRELAFLIKKQNLLPLFDVAYQGFGSGLAEDVQSIRLFTESFDEIIIANSYSKNFGLYGERVGSLLFITKNSQIKESALSQIKIQVRTCISNPPRHGAMVVKHILTTPTLRTMWENEVSIMRDRINIMRYQFVKKLHEKKPEQDFSWLLQQKGMFFFSGLNPSQVESLKEKYGIYMTMNGRISIAGLCSSNIDYVTDSIVNI